MALAGPRGLAFFRHVFPTLGVTIGLAHAHPTFALTVVFPFTGIRSRFAFAFAFTVIHAMTLTHGHFSP